MLLVVVIITDMFQVGFLHENEISEVIEMTLEDTLKNANVSRSFTVQVGNLAVLGEGDESNESAEGAHSF
jgi:hypothetical protein